MKLTESAVTFASVLLLAATAAAQQVVKPPVDHQCRSLDLAQVVQDNAAALHGCLQRI